MKLEWSDTLKYGIVVIDNQHENAVKQINKITDMIDKRNSIFELVVEIKELEDIVKSHSITEERYMHKHQYPTIDEHCEDHRIFLNNIGIIKKALLKQGVTQAISNIILSQVNEWYEKHLLTYDKELSEFLIKKNIRY